MVLDQAAGMPPLAFDSIDATGKPIAQTKLMWSQTEAIKAFVARAEFLGDDDAAQRIIPISTCCSATMSTRTFAAASSR